MPSGLRYRHRTSLQEDVHDVSSSHRTSVFKENLMGFNYHGSCITATNQTCSVRLDGDGHLKTQIMNPWRIAPVSFCMYVHLFVVRGHGVDFVSSQYGCYSSGMHGIMFRSGENTPRIQRSINDIPGSSSTARILVTPKEACMRKSPMLANGGHDSLHRYDVAIGGTQRSTFNCLHRLPTCCW